MDGQETDKTILRARLTGDRRSCNSESKMHSLCHGANVVKPSVLLLLLYLLVLGTSPYQLSAL